MAVAQLVASLVAAALVVLMLYGLRALARQIDDLSYRVEHLEEPDGEDRIGP